MIIYLEHRGNQIAVIIKRNLNERVVPWESDSQYKQKMAFERDDPHVIRLRRARVWRSKVALLQLIPAP